MWNLSVVAGEWALFSDEEVRRNVLRVVNRPPWLRWLNARPGSRLIDRIWSDFLRRTDQG